MLESVVKNCGSIVHVDIATHDFMDFMKEQAKVAISLLPLFLSINVKKSGIIV